MTYAVEFQNVSRLYGDVRAVDGLALAYAMENFLDAGSVRLG